MNSPQSPAPISPDTAVVALASKVLPVWIRQLATSRAQSEEAVAEMLSAFGDIGPLLKPAARLPDGQTKPVAELIERMYVGFQYQDRISQMMGLLLEDMQRMLNLMADPAQKTADALNQSNWLERLESQYAMAEQRRDHNGSTSNEHPHDGTSAKNADGDTDFF